MKNENIKWIEENKEKLIKSGFEFPTQEIESATSAELANFVGEAKLFLAGY